MANSDVGKLASSIGMQLPIEILRSYAGFYIGTFNPEQGPFTRESDEYWQIKSDAEEAMRSGNWTQREDL